MTEKKKISSTSLVLNILISQSFFNGCIYFIELVKNIIVTVSYRNDTLASIYIKYGFFLRPILLSILCFMLGFLFIFFKDILL